MVSMLGLKKIASILFPKIGNLQYGFHSASLLITDIGPLYLIFNCIGFKCYENFKGKTKNKKSHTKIMNKATTFLRGITWSGKCSKRIIIK